MHFSFFRTITLLTTCVIALTSFVSCSKDEKPVATEAKAQLPFKGRYTWQFTIPNMGEQLSVHTFYPDSIQYSMAGNAYTNAYTQVMVAYNEAEQRCITIGKGGGKDNVYFLMFFKDITDRSITIYKKQCDSRSEAETLAVPDDNTTADHGWNVYNKQ